MSKIKNTLKQIWKDESGQAATEYILLVVVIVAVVALFGGEIREALTDKIAQLRDGIDSVGQ